MKKEIFSNEKGETIQMTEEHSEPTLSIYEFFEIATLKQKELLSELYENAEKEAMILKKINTIYESVRNGVYSSCGTVTVCESVDDANIISLELKGELEKVRKDIGALLKKAVDELHMGNVGIIQRQYNNYIK